MTRLRRGSSRAWVACAAALIGAAAITSGCGSGPTAEPEGGGVAQEAAQAPGEVPTEEVAADEPAPAEDVGPAQSPGPSTPPAARVAPSQQAAQPATPVQAAPAAEAPAPVQAVPTAEAASPVEAAPPAAVDWAGSTQKWVPIFSLESEGVYLGAAQIAGPTSQVAKVKGVAELRLRFKDIGRIYAYVPVSTISLTKLSRVQGVSVWAIGDLQLAEL